MVVSRRDPMRTVFVGQYLEDGERVIEILEVGSSGAIGQDIRARFDPLDRRPTDVTVEEEMVRINPIDLAQKWRPIRRTTG